jgi:phosphoglucomutase
MTAKIDPRAGLEPDPKQLIDVTKLAASYYAEVPDPGVAEQRVSFGTSGHRGSSLKKSFNDAHVAAITQALCEYRQSADITGPLYLGIDTHALSEPAATTALEVLAANGVDVMLAKNDEFTPTPAVSHAILTHNRGLDSGHADGIVVTPSHNPPEDGGFKYNPPHGGPADIDVTQRIEARANALLKAGLKGVRRIPHAKALRASTTHRHDFLNGYVNDLKAVLDLKAIADAGVRMAVDPLGGAGVHYWRRIAERYKLDLTVLSEQVDPTFRFMALDWDGRIRMDPSSRYAMHKLIALKDRYDVAFACDTDHDRHGIVAPGAGLMPPNHYLAAAVGYLLGHRPQWNPQAGVGKTLVSSQMIDRVAAKFRRPLVEVPVGFKWFVSGLFDGSLAFGCEESAGAAFVRRDGSPWTTDKDGIILALLAGEITACTGHDPAHLYAQYEREWGVSSYSRIDAPANAAQRKQLAALSADRITRTELAGEEIVSIVSRAPGNDAPIDGIKVATEHGWFAARPSGTEPIYKIYVESLLGPEHLQHIATDAQAIVDEALASADGHTSRA